MEPLHKRERGRIRARLFRGDQGERRAATAPRSDRPGQSMTEFALVVPIFLLLMLGGVNIGLAIRAHLQLSQVAQQAAQILVHHPEDANVPTVVNYINSLSSYQVTASNVQVITGTSVFTTNTAAPLPLACTAGNTCAMQDTVVIKYPFGVIFPMAGKLSVGLLQNGSINLGTTESTIAATNPPTILHVCYSTTTVPCKDAYGAVVSTGANQHVVTWVRPPEAELPPTGRSLYIPKYCITVHYTHTPTSGSPPPPPTFPTISIGCFTGPTSTSTSWPNTSNLYYLDTTDYTGQADQLSQVYYAVSALQVNGVQSAFSATVDN